MKNTMLLLTIGLIALSCKKDADPKPDTCQFSTSPSVNNVTYDANERVATLITAVYNGTAAVEVLSTFTYNQAGKLNKTVYTVNNALISQETYTYSDNHLTQTNFSGPNSPTGINNLGFDAAGRLTRYTVEVGGQLQYAQTYGYDQDGILTEEAAVDAQGNILYKVVTRPVGKVKSPDALLVKRGLPYLIPSGTPLVEAEGNIGTVKEYYGSDASGKLTLQASQKITAVKTNPKGYLTELTMADLDGKNPITLSYTLADCQ